METTKRKIRIAAVAAIVLISVAISHDIHRRYGVLINGVDRVIERNANQVSELRAEHDRLKLSASNDGPRANTLEELERMRAEAAALRNRTNELTALREENRQLQASLVKAGQTPGLEAKLQAQQLSNLRIKQSEYWHPAFQKFITESQDEELTNIDQIAKYLPDNALADTNFSVADYELVYRGPRAWMSRNKTSAIIALREKQSREWPGAGWERIYIFLDGGGNYQRTPDGNFDAWEKEHTAAPGNPLR